MRVDLPSTIRNPISLIGMAVATAMAVVFVALLALEFAGQLENPYVGLLSFVAVPAVFVLGLLLIPLGSWLQRRRLAKGLPAEDWPVIDLRLARTRALIIIVAALTCVNLLIVSLGAYGAVHHMESREFCGNTCHTAMEPEWRASAVAPHAKVACVSCHVGPGSKALIESKIAGTRQLWHVITNNVSKPVPVPVHNMRPANETCTVCHSSDQDHGDRLKQIREYADDEAGTETVTTLQVHVGGGSAARGAGSGIHWHMNIGNKVEYIATDTARLNIGWVKFTDRSGKVREYVGEGVTADQIAKGERRVMDCLDCHNRPAHTLEPGPERAIDNAITAGLVSRELPFARRESIAAVKDTYDTNEAARAGIDKRLRTFYKISVDEAALKRMISGTQDVYSRNIFPQMKVGWGTYANHLGHTSSTGCFRCHDDNHKSSDGGTIKQDCESCHEMK